MKNWFCIILMIVSLVSMVNAQELDDSSEGEDLRLTVEELDAFKQQALRTVEDLGTYIKIIVDKANSLERKNNNVQLAMALFATDSNTVEISSLKTPQKYVKRIRKYLIAVRDLPYQSVGIHLSSEFKKGPDGKYYGTASICQTFEATLLGADGAKWPKKKDTTCKNIQLVVEQLNCLDGLKEKKCWVLKLGDIKVDEQRLN